MRGGGSASLRFTAPCDATSVVVRVALYKGRRLVWRSSGFKVAIRSTGTTGGGGGGGTTGGGTTGGGTTGGGTTGGGSVHRTSPTIAAIGSSGGSGQAVVDRAASMAGKPYCWDGGDTSGPTHGSGDRGNGGCGAGVVGFDCTGLVIYALYQALHISGFPHSAGNAWAQKGTVIPSKAQLQPGDIVFFGGTSFANFTHAGVYAGNGKMWDAANYNVPVALHSMWSSGYIGAVRYWAQNGTGGGFEAAFQANTGSLWTVGSAGNQDWKLGMMSGTSPSITALPGGGFEAAFQANTGSLWTVGSAGNQDWKLGMK